jgi:hypothetical protein
MNTSDKIIQFPSYQPLSRELEQQTERRARLFAESKAVSLDLLVDQATQAFEADIDVGEKLLTIIKRASKKQQRRGRAGFSIGAQQMACEMWRERIQKELDVLKWGDLRALWLRQ